MICPECHTPQGHERCLSVNCCCRHQGSPVRPLTAYERHLRMNGLMLPVVMPANDPEVLPR